MAINFRVPGLAALIIPVIGYIVFRLLAAPDVHLDTRPSPAMTMMTLIIAVAIAVMAFHALVCLFVYFNPEVAAEEIAKPDRPFWAWIYLTTLQMNRNDPEMDLVQTGLPMGAIANNCRRRALLGMGSFVLGVVLVVFLITQVWKQP